MDKGDQSLIKAVGKSTTEEYSDGEKAEHRTCGRRAPAEEGWLPRGPRLNQKTLHSMAAIGGGVRPSPILSFSCKQIKAPVVIPLWPGCSAER